MNKEISGFGYEFVTELFGGPLDGYRGTVMSINNEKPPEMWIEKIVEEKKEKKNLGARFLERCVVSFSPEDKVAVYKMSDSKTKESGICCYSYLETTDHENYIKKYKSQ
jgi:hypothetical protein